MAHRGFRRHSSRAADPPSLYAAQLGRDLGELAVDVSLFAILFAIVCALMRVGEEKESLLHVPWSTLIMIGGMGMLVSIAVKAGTISLLAGWVGHTPRLLIPVVLCFLAAVLNMFGGSFVGVVAPALFPVVATSRGRPA
ncbi:dicarboxylate carrier MatC-like [Cutibacterium acnes JCM 18916]|nr:dicarboxylate carrier MatC-like [Cutibacterium acnes JCM 18916]